MAVLSFPTRAAVPVAVVGSGVAGMACALALAPRPVVLITKTEDLPGGSSLWAQGGIAAAVGADDSPEAHAADTITAGAGLVDAAIAALVAGAGPAAIESLEALGVAFDRAGDHLSIGREAAHGLPRIVHAGGDQTGRRVVEALAACVRAAPHIRLLTETLALDLIQDSTGRVRGLRLAGAEGAIETLPVAAVVLATGGIGRVWRDTTNPAEATGDGLAMAARAGAELADMEFMQFHPTALAATATGDGRRPLLTEALRGAGAVLRDGDGTRFMVAEHPDAELAPRDVVARAVGLRAAAGQGVFLDARSLWSPQAFPQVAALCAEAGLDPARDLLPIVPAAHYHMGGVATDALGRTSVPGLLACGEVARTGLHGANRLASNSLLEAVVFGQRAAEGVAADLATAEEAPPDTFSFSLSLPTPGPHEETLAVREALRTVMSRRVGLVRDQQGLEAALGDIATLTRRFAALPLSPAAPVRESLRAWAETRNLLLVAQLVALAALHRSESRGAHCRLDHPAPDPAQARPVLFHLPLPGDSSYGLAPSPDYRTLSA